MNKQELMAFFQAYITATDRLRDLNNEMLYLETKMKNFEDMRRPKPCSTLEQIILALGTAVLCSIWVFPVIAFIFLATSIDDFFRGWFQWIDFVVNHPFISGTILALLCSIIIQLPVWIVFYKHDTTHRYNSDLEEYNIASQEYPKLQSRYHQLPAAIQSASAEINRLQSLNYVHRDYLPYARTLLSYLEKGRADTLKEALNLLELKFREDVRDEEIRGYFEDRAWQERVQSQQQASALQSMQEDARQAAKAAQNAELWSSVSAYVSTSEAKRQRKKDSGSYW